jgi:Family of unknown function (DUF6511)
MTLAKTPALHCAICTKAASGIRYQPTKKSGQRWNLMPGAMRPALLCSMRCSALYQSLCHLWSTPMLAPDRMQKIEALAHERCLAPLGDVIANIGMDRPVSDYQRAEVLAVIAAVVSAYQAAVVEIGEQVLIRERAYFAAQGKTHPLDEVPF